MRTRWLLPLLALLTACATPRLNPALKPTDPVARWEHGQGLVEQRRGDLKLLAAFSQAAVGLFEFDLTFINDGTQAVTLNPSDIACLLQIWTDHGPADHTIQAEDPEAHLRALDQATVDRQHQKQVNAGLGLFSIVLDLADTAANARKRTPEEQRKVQHDQERLREELHRSNERLTADQARLQAQRSEAATTRLRRHTLAPGEQVRGRIVLRLSAPALMKAILKVPFGGESFEFGYAPL